MGIRPLPVDPPFPFRKGDTATEGGGGMGGGTEDDDEGKGDDNDKSDDGVAGVCASAEVGNLHFCCFPSTFSDDRRGIRGLLLAADKETRSHSAADDAPATAVNSASLD